MNNFNLIKNKIINIKIFNIYFFYSKLVALLKNIKGKFMVQINNKNDCTQLYYSPQFYSSPQLYYNTALLISMPHLDFLKKNNHIIWLILALVTIYILLTMINERIKENIKIWIWLFFIKIICLVVICYFSKTIIPPEIVMVSFYFALYQFLFVLMRSYQWTGGTIRFWHWPRGVKIWLTSPRYTGIMLRVLTKKINPNNIYANYINTFLTTDFFIDSFGLLIAGSMINTIYYYYVLNIVPPDIIDMFIINWIPMFWNMFYLNFGLILFIEFAVVFNYVGLYFILFLYWLYFSKDPHFIDFCDVFLIKGLRQPGTYLNHCKTTLLLGLIIIFFGLVLL